MRAAVDASGSYDIISSTFDGQPGSDIFENYCNGVLFYIGMIIETIVIISTRNFG